MSAKDPPMPRAPDGVDVMLLLEGTFPYVRGGVSSWVNQIVRGFPELRFGAIFLGSRSSDYDGMKYPLPDNLVHLEVHYLHDRRTNAEFDLAQADPGRGRVVPADVELMARTHDTLRTARDQKQRDPDDLKRLMRELMARMHGDASDHAAMSEHRFLYGASSWDYITAQYRERCTDPSFVDYFWTVRIMHAPIWHLARIADAAPPARAYHSISTGYAGFLGAYLRSKTGKPFLLSEHGIYTKERKIDLFQSEWIADNRGIFERDSARLSYFRELWIRFFESLGQLCYACSDRIVALYETNRLRQIADGAPAERTQNIPNGIDLPRLSRVRATRDGANDPPPVACLIGRVVPIKDIKTFVRAMRSVVNHMPHAQGWIAGPEDEDPAYARECRAIVEGLGLTEHVKFLGFQNIDTLLPKIGLNVLSSISEALPLVLLEGFAAGVPAVATDVGSCGQLIHGLDAEDRALGSAGALVQIADPQALGAAIVALLGDGQRWRQAQAAGLARVERYYTQERMFASYRALYEEALAWPA
ncbi:MAG TPA: GT4 family glycosyltransferase PelF [Burkholderiaceae bacterium]|nr:GT4 family glycosyltransferase PelF [Burkholderiaceae bacterium]